MEFRKMLLMIQLEGQQRRQDTVYGFESWKIGMEGGIPSKSFLFFFPMVPEGHASSPLLCLLCCFYSM